MPLIVEDGTGKDDAQTFVSEEELVIFAGARGITITEEQAAIHLVKAMDLIILNESGIPGRRSIENQALPFPRTDFFITNNLYFTDEIPMHVKLAQMWAAIYSFNGIDLNPTQQNGKVLIKKKTGPIEKQWAYNENQSVQPDMPHFIAYMNLIASRNQGMGNIRVRRG